MQEFPLAEEDLGRYKPFRSMGLVSGSVFIRLDFRLCLLTLVLEDSAALPDASKSEPLSEPADELLLFFLFFEIFGSFPGPGVSSLLPT